MSEPAEATGPATPSTLDPALDGLWRTDTVVLDGFQHQYAFAEPGRTAAHPLLALHGFGTSGYRTFRFVAPQLHRAGVPLYAPDLLGFGGSEKPDEHVYSLERYAAHAVAFAEKLHLGRPVLVGHSMGGKVAAAAAVLYEQHFSGLVLINPGGFNAFARLNTALAGRPWVLRLFEQDWFFHRLLPLTPLGRIFASEANRRELHRLRHSHAALDLDATGLRSRFQSVSLPVLLVWGEADPLLPRRSIHAVRRAFPHAEVAPLPGAGHAPMKDRPDQLAALLARFCLAITD